MARTSNNAKSKVMYAGPNIPVLGLVRGTVYTDIPATVPDDVKFMFCAVSEYSAKLNNIVFLNKCAEIAAKQRSK